VAEQLQRLGLDTRRVTTLLAGCRLEPEEALHVISIAARQPPSADKQAWIERAFTDRHWWRSALLSEDDLAPEIRPEVKLRIVRWK